MVANYRSSKANLYITVTFLIRLIVSDFYILTYPQYILITENACIVAFEKVTLIMRPTNNY